MKQEGGRAGRTLRGARAAAFRRGRVISLYGNDSDMPLSGAVKMPSITILYYFQTSYTGPSIEDSSGGRLPLLEGTVTGLIANSK